MRKILSVLAVLAVLGLGGCSVSDDDGGDENIRGDDVVTVYPDVVEASRTAVDGGYLVQYRMESRDSLGVKEFNASLFVQKVLEIIGASDNVMGLQFAKLNQRLASAEVWVKMDNSGAYISCIYRLSYLTLSKDYSAFYFNFFAAPNPEDYRPKKTVTETGDVGSYTFSGFDCERVYFTIFEPKE